MPDARDRAARRLRRPPGPHRRGRRPHRAGRRSRAPTSRARSSAARPARTRRDLIRPPDLDWLAALPPIVRRDHLAPEPTGVIDAIDRLAARGVLVCRRALGRDLRPGDLGRVRRRRPARHPLLQRHAAAAPSRPRGRSAPRSPTTGSPCRSSPTSSTCTRPRSRSPSGPRPGPGRPRHRRGRVAARSAGDRSSTAPRPRLPDGTLAGSALTMDRASPTSSHHCGVSLADAVSAGKYDPGAPARPRRPRHDRARPPGRPRGPRPDLTVEATWVGGSPSRRLGSTSMRIIAALFIEGIQLRQVAGPVHPHRPHRRAVLRGRAGAGAGHPRPAPRRARALPARRVRHRRPRGHLPARR